MQRLQYPFPLFFDQRGALVDAGRIYVGEAGADPEVEPIDVFWDAAGTIPAAQPLRTRGGVIVNNGSPAIAFVSEADYSMRVRDADGNLVSYAPSATDAGAVAAYQPENDDLTAISEQLNTAFGLSLLTVADAAALQALLSIATGLPLTGGTVSGNIVRQGAGSHLYHNDAALTSGKVFVTAAGASDPTSNPGDIWLKY